MNTRRTLFGAAPAFAATLVAAGSTRAQSATDSSKIADFLFVQTAKGMTFKKAENTLALEGVSPVTLFFADRPERIAGNMKTSKFVPFWSQGKDSFLSDPPNADVSILEGEQLRQVVVGTPRPCATRRQPGLHCQSPARRDADPGSRRLRVHRHHWDATYTLVIRRCRTAQLPTGCPLSIDGRHTRKLTQRHAVARANANEGTFSKYDGEQNHDQSN